MPTTLDFNDTDEFYSRLNDALKSGSEVEILTNFKTPKDVPDRLQSALGGKQFNTELNKLSASASSALIAGSASSFQINWVVLCGCAGAAIGAATGGPPGAVAGGVIGICIGFVASIVREDADKEITLEVGLDGKLKVKIKTTKK